MAYTPPGVTVQEFASPSVASLLSLPARIALVGVSAGIITRTDLVGPLTGTTAVPIPNVPSDATMAAGAVTKVMDANNPGNAAAGYVVTTDYVFSNSAKTIARASSGGIASGSYVYVTYGYTPADYFKPILLDNMSDVQDRFGPSWDTTGTDVYSPLSQAAQVAFENGAQQIILQPLTKITSGVRAQPVAADVADAAVWADNFAILRDIDEINIVVPIVGQSQSGSGGGIVSSVSVTDSIQLSIGQGLQDHCKFMKTDQQYVISLFGEDGTDSGDASKATLLSHAATLAGRYGGEMSQQTVFLSPSKFLRPQPGASGGTKVLGGQFAAAGLAGMIAAREVSQTLTRKVLSGFTQVADARTKAEKNTDATAGLLVLEQKGGIIQVRHAVTLDTTATAKRELSVVRAKHRVIESVRDTLETQIIGQVIADGEAPNVVGIAVQGVLEDLRSNRDIVSYGGVQARTLQLDPTTIEVRFSYKPAFPVNYVSVGFTLDLTSNTITASSGTGVTN